MSEEQVLLIGGHRDGDVVVVHDKVPDLKFPQRTPVPSTWSHQPPIAKPLTEMVVYRRHVLGTTVVYALDGIDPLAALIDGYRKP